MTKLTYLNDTYLFESTATFLEVKSHEKGTAIILDNTIFYPQGGGQPADNGIISSNTAKFKVTDVRLDKTGTVWHFGEFLNGIFESNTTVNLKIDKERRLLNTKIHSAGHLIDCAMTELAIRNLTPIKGFHFPEGPNVEYKGTIENPMELIPKLQQIVNKLIKQNLKIDFNNLSPEEAKEKGIWAPEGKSSRIVDFEGYPSCGCGGTHVNSTSEIGKITIRKIKCKKGNTKIAYIVE